MQLRLIAFLMFSVQLLNASDYVIPSSRTIDWYPAGLDVVGGIPTTFSATNTIAGLHNDGSVNDAVTIQTAIINAASNTVLFIPAGTYLIDASVLLDSRSNPGNLLMTNGVVLRGAKPCVAPWLPTDDATATTFNMVGSSRINFFGGAKDSSWSPVAQTGMGITAGYAKGSTSLTVSNSAGFSIGDIIAVYQNRDTNWIDDKSLTYLGEDSGPDAHVWAQYTTITNVTGNAIDIYPPLYQVTPNPTGQSIRRQTTGIQRAGLENIRINGTSGGLKLIRFNFAKHCWVKGIETYNAVANSSGSPHIWMDFSYACEVQRCHLHHSQGHDSGACYGVEFYNWNSRHKIVNNIIRETRHSVGFEGGGSGCVILYNYTDDNWESVQGQPTTIDNTILSEDGMANHGAHPYMNLWEGNHATAFAGDYTQGSSSHITAFRNSLTGKRSSYPLASPFLWAVVEIEKYNLYYNMVGNVIGNPLMSGGVVTNSGSGQITNMFRFGYTSAGGTYFGPEPFTSAILHGNYDFVTAGVNDWESSDHTMVNSLYYTSRPTWFGNRTWPPFDSSNPAASQTDRTNTPAGYLYVYGTDWESNPRSITGGFVSRGGKVSR